MDKATEEFIQEIKRTKSLPLLELYLKAKASEVVDHLKQDTKKRVGEFVKREQTPYTQNHYLFENVCKL